MATYTIRKLVSKPDARLDRLGARLDVRVEQGGGEASAGDGSSSSSAFVDLAEGASSSSSSVPELDVLHLFLFRLFRGPECFLGVCSPQDLETWPVETPDPATGYFRRSEVSASFRKAVILDRFWENILADIQELAAALKILASLRDAETLEYAFADSAPPSGSSSGGSSSSSQTLDGRRFILQRAGLTPYPPELPVGYRLHVTCEAVGTDSKIFLHRNDLPDRDDEIHARPIAVCSPGDLVDYPADEPNEDQFPDHYRLNDLDVVSGDLKSLNTSWNSIKVDVRELAAVLRFHEDEITDTDVETVEFEV